MPTYTTQTVASASADSQYSSEHAPINAFNLATSLTGPSGNNAWAAADGVTGGVSIKGVFASGKIIRRVLYNNFFDVVGGSNAAGIAGFSLWGSNDGFNWTQLVCNVGSMDIHVNNDQADTKSIYVDNPDSYTQHSFYIYGNHGHESVVGVRRLELQTEDGWAPEDPEDPPPPPPTPVVPTVTTAAITNITASDADGGGNVTATGGAAVTARGVCWNTTGNPTIANSKTINGSGLGAFASSITPLTAPTTYYVRAYATNSAGTGYGTQVSFTTIAPPTVTTASPASKIKNTSAIVGGSIVATGGASPTVRGVCYNTTGTPTTADGKVEESGTYAAGSFSETLTGLTRATFYYARAYATNSEGTAYGAVVTFTTLSVESIADPQISLADTFYMPRAGRYADPLNTNDALPLPYGDLTDGAAGIWTLPCIDTVNFVYCFAAYPVLSVANGNSVSIYADGVLVDPANYTFDEDNDYESEGQIATVTFTADQKNAVITARGKGKVLTGTTLLENIIDVVNDFLTVQNNFTADLFEATAKARARQVFDAQGYAAAGVVTEDGVIWDIVIGMMASFIGSAYLNGSGKLVLEIDDGVMSLYGATILRKGEVTLLDARQRLVNIINQCPAHFAFNYVDGMFKRETNTSAHADAISQGVHGIREPNAPFQLFWCRNLTDAQTLQDIIVAKFKDPIYEIEIEDGSLKHLHLDVGDFFVLTVDGLYEKTGLELVNHYWRIVSVRPEYAAARIVFRALQTPYYLTSASLADGTYLADGSTLAGNERDMTVY